MTERGEHTPGIVDLLPCPFCGVVATGAHKAGSAWFIDCEHEPTCIEADFQRTEAEAIAAWNTRPEAADLISELVGALDKAQVVIDYAAERLWIGRLDAIQQRPAHIDAALREVRTVAAKARGGAE